MISRRHRFHGHGSIKYLFGHGQTIRTPMFGVRYVNNSRRENYRLAVIVSKKVAPKAVTRNKIRRRLFEAVRQSYESDLGSVDIAIFVYDARVAEIESSFLLEELEPVFSKITGSSRATAQPR